MNETTGGKIIALLRLGMFEKRVEVPDDTKQYFWQLYLDPGHPLDPAHPAYQDNSQRPRFDFFFARTDKTVPDPTTDLPVVIFEFHRVSIRNVQPKPANPYPNLVVPSSVKTIINPNDWN